MLIGIDASRASGKFRTGTENYSLNLILSLAKIDRKNNYILYLRPGYDRQLYNLPGNFKLKIIKNKRFWTQIGLSAEMYFSPPDVLFVPSHILPIITPRKSVVTIHDFAWKYFPDAYTVAEIRLQNLAIRRAIKKKATIIVYSHSTHSDLTKFYRLPTGLIKFVPMGFEPEKSPGVLSEKLKKLITTRYILSVGRLERKKNTLNLIRAYAILRNERKIKEKLLLVGKPGYGYELIKQEINKNKKIKKDIIETGFISNNELTALYRGASLFAFPSFYEGFGYPILEAFAVNTPVITSNTSSMPEVANGAALLANPKKPFEIAAAMSRILNKPSLCRSLIPRGRARLKYYSWETCARETLRVLEGTV